MKSGGILDSSLINSLLLRFSRTLNFLAQRFNNDYIFNVYHRISFGLLFYTFLITNEILFKMIDHKSSAVYGNVESIKWFWAQHFFP